MQKILLSVALVGLITSCNPPAATRGTHNGSVYDIGGTWSVKLDDQAAGTMVINQGSWTDFTGTYTPASGGSIAVTGDAGIGNINMTIGTDFYSIAGTWDFQTDSSFSGTYVIPKANSTFLTGKIDLTRTAW